MGEAKRKKVYRELNPPGQDLDTHHLLDIREPGEVLIALRQELANHPEIVEAAMKGNNFEDCLGIIGAQLDIALDGDYDPVQLMSMLIVALRNRRNGVKVAHNLAPGLMNVELEEKEGTVELVEAAVEEVKKQPPKARIIH